MGTYLLKFSACLVVFWLVYILLLEQQKMHRFKRFYLLGAFAIALVIPLLSITHYIEPVTQQVETPSIYLPIESSNMVMPIQPKASISKETLLWYFYGLGVLIFSVRFIINLSRFYGKISKNEKVSRSSFIYVLLKEYRIPHSFFKFIFLNQEKFKNGAIPKEVLLHEETHAKQLHSLDIILVELLQIAFWFHPLVYILKHHIKLNHEFLADQAVLNRGIDTKNYQNTLLQFSSNTRDYQLSSAINYSSFKKRFTVMKTQTSKTRIWLSTLLLLPIIGILYYTFAERVEVEKDNSDLVESVKNDLIEAEKYKIQYVGQNYVEVYLKKYKKYEALRNTEPHYINKSKEEQQQMEVLFSDLGGMYFRMSKANKSQVKRPVSPVLPYAKITLNGKTYYKNRAKLTKEERATLPPPPPPAMKKSKGGPNSNDQIDSFLTPQKEVTKKEIASYNAWAKQIHSESKVLSEDATWYPPINEQDLIKHADIYKRMSPKQKNSCVEFPFPGLDVKKGNTPFAVDSNNSAQQDPPSKKELDAYNAWVKKKKEEFKKRPKSETIEGQPYLINDETFRYYKTIYNRMTPNQKKALESLPEAVLVTEWPMPKYTIVETVSQPKQQKATQKQIAVYNTWAKAINDKMAKAKANDDVNEYPIVKVKEVNKYKAIYAIMTEAQKKVAEPWPSFPPLPIHPAPSAPERATVIEIAEYDVWAKKMNTAIKKANESKSYEYPIIKLKEVNKYKHIYYNLMTQGQRQNAEPFPSAPPPPPAPPKPSKNKSKDSKDGNPGQQSAKIHPIEIIIDNDKKLQLNGKIIDLDAIKGEVKKLNQNLSNEDHRKYVTASIILEKNKNLDFANSVKEELRKVNVWISSIAYNENLSKSSLHNKPFSLYSGLTLEEAKAKEKKIFSEPVKIDTSKTNPWKVSFGTATYEYIDDDGNSTGKVNFNPKKASVRNDTPKIYVNKKELTGAKIKLTKEELKKLQLTLSSGNIIAFKLKIPGVKTDYINGNTISKTSIANLSSMKKGVNIAIFDITDDNGSKIPPIIIEIKD